MLLFDHVQTFAGASGAPMTNLSGVVVGIQCFEVSYTVHGYCISYDDPNVDMLMILRLKIRISCRLWK
jgi:hypothetical protein